MNKKERFNQVLSGEASQYPLVSSWHHFLEAEYEAEALAEATIQLAQEHDWDWIKINPRAVYLAEAFGNVYDPDDYRDVFPRQLQQRIQTPADVWQVPIVEAATSAPLQEQLQAVKQIRSALPEMPLVQTLFSPLTILLFLTGNTSYVNQTMYGSNAPLDVKKLLETEGAGVHQALDHITETMIDYLKELEKNGIDGVFYAVTGTANEELFAKEIFDEFSLPYDLRVLKAVAGKRLLHTCGEFSQPERFDDYPVDGISWDTYAKGNPDLSVPLKKVKIGGLDHQLFGQDKRETIRQQTDQALKQMEGVPFLLTPNCAVPVNVTPAELQDIKENVERKREKR